MARPRKNCSVAFIHGIDYFKPRGIPMTKLEEICITIEEREAVRLADYKGLTHEEARQYMNVSRTTYGRILRRARATIAKALIDGKALKVEGGNYEIKE